MLTTLDEKEAHCFDRFTTDINKVFKRWKKEIPKLEKTKFREPIVDAEVYVFWYKDENGNKNFLTI